jgi:6-hydroxytryprostatin B O-methyltransferase
MPIEQVGGGRGRLSFALAEKYPDLTFVVQDRPKIGEHIEYPPHLKDRVSFEAHDFFTPQSIAAEVYLLGAVLHDWPDNRAIEIIQNLVPAMKDGSRIILAENVKMQSGSQSYFFEAIIRYTTPSSLHNYTYHIYVLVLQARFY